MTQSPNPSRPPVARPAVPAARRLPYPHTPATDVVENLHGTEVADPYRWLEETGGPAARAWIDAQNRLTSGFLETIPGRSRIRERLSRLWEFPVYGVPWRRGRRIFYTCNEGLRNQALLYTMRTEEEEPRILLDPNLLSDDGTTSAGAYEVTDDARFLAYQVSAAGSDWVEIRVREVETGRDLEDRIRWVKFSAIAWEADGSAFYYSAYDEPSPERELLSANYNQKLLRHRLGTPQSEDLVVCERPGEKDLGFTGGVTEDGRYLVISVWRGSEQKNLIFYKDLSDPLGPVIELIREFEASWILAGNNGPIFWFWTDLDAPRGRLIAADLRSPSRARWVEILPEREETLLSVTMVGDHFVAHYLKDAHSLIRVHRLNGTYLRTVGLPGIGTVYGFDGRRDESGTFFSFASYTTPDTIYRHDMTTGVSTVFRRPKLDFNPSDYETSQVFYTSRDGTRIPMFLTHRRGLKRDGSHPAWLYGYGGFRISNTPAFSPAELAWMEMGGVYAVANLRGGGEYGEDWHQAGMKSRKQNVFDDFIAAAQWLVANRYTAPARLAIGGRSNGGLLVGACLTQRPDLFGAAVAGVGVFDMLRFHKFTIGWAWVSDYGSPDDPEMFPVLRAYSPLHNVKTGVSYPATLILTGDHDDRVVPAHSFKFAATLQAAQAGPAPILIRIDTKAGHGLGKPTRMLIEEAADRLAFLSRALGMENAIPPSSSRA